MPTPANAPPSARRADTSCHCVAGTGPHPGDEPAFGEWHTLLLAVRTRLHDVLEAWPVLAETPEQRAAAAHSRALALECAEALDHLHDTLVGQARRCGRLAAELEQARADLTRHAAHR